MADATPSTCSVQDTIPRFSQHIVRHAYSGLLSALDVATEAERDLEMACDDHAVDAFDPAMSGYLRASELAWDKVTDALEATIEVARKLPEGGALCRMAFCLRDVLASDTDAEFGETMAAARLQIARTAILPGMPPGEKDLLQLLQLTASRLDALESIRQHSAPSTHLTHG